MTTRRSTAPSRRCSRRWTRRTTRCSSPSFSCGWSTCASRPGAASCEWSRCGEPLPCPSRGPTPGSTASPSRRSRRRRSGRTSPTRRMPWRPPSSGRRPSVTPGRRRMPAPRHPWARSSPTAPEEPHWRRGASRPRRRRATGGASSTRRCGRPTPRLGLRGPNGRPACRNGGDSSRPSTGLTRTSPGCPPTRGAGCCRPGTGRVARTGSGSPWALTPVWRRTSPPAWSPLSSPRSKGGSTRRRTTSPGPTSCSPRPRASCRSSSTWSARRSGSARATPPAHTRPRSPGPPHRACPRRCVSGSARWRHGRSPTSSRRRGTSTARPRCWRPGSTTSSRGSRTSSPTAATSRRIRRSTGCPRRPLRRRDGPGTSRRRRDRPLAARRRAPGQGAAVGRRLRDSPCG